MQLKLVLVGRRLDAGRGAHPVVAREQLIERDVTIHTAMVADTIPWMLTRGSLSETMGGRSKL